MKNRQAAPVLRRQAGLSMVEVLVALVIFAFGLLGSAGLQLSTLRSNQFAASSAVATSLGKEYGEIMQSFPSAIKSTTGTATNSFFLDTSTYSGAATASACNGPGATCTTDQVAGQMVSDWVERVKAALPGGRAEVCRDTEPRDAEGKLEWGGCDGTGDLIVIKLGWLARNDKGEVELGTSRPMIAMALMGNLKDFAVTP